MEKELKTLKNFERSVGVDFAGEVINTLLKELRVEAVKIFNETLTIEEFGEKMVRFFAIQEENLK